MVPRTQTAAIDEIVARLDRPSARTVKSSPRSDMARKSTSPAPRRLVARPSLGATPKKFTYSAIGETTVDADERRAR